MASEILGTPGMPLVRVTNYITLFLESALGLELVLIMARGILWLESYSNASGLF